MGSKKKLILGFYAQKKIVSKILKGPKLLFESYGVSGNDFRSLEIGAEHFERTVHYSNKYDALRYVSRVVHTVES